MIKKKTGPDNQKIKRKTVSFDANVSMSELKMKITDMSNCIADIGYKSKILDTKRKIEQMIVPTPAETEENFELTVSSGR